MNHLPILLATLLVLAPRPPETPVLLALELQATKVRPRASGLSGSVSQNGRPIRASIEVTGRGSIEQGPVHRVETKEDGSFTVDGLSPGSFEVLVYFEGSGRSRPESVLRETVTVGPNQHPFLALEVPPDRPEDHLTGRVLDTAGRPIEGARVIGHPNVYMVCSLNQETSATSGADGTYRLRVPRRVADGEAFRISVHSGMQSVQREGARGAAADFDVSLPETGTLELHVVVPVALRPLHLKYVDWRPTGRTAAGGTRPADYECGAYDVVCEDGVLTLELPAGPHDFVLVPETPLLAPLRLDAVAIALESTTTVAAVFERGHEVELRFLNTSGEPGGPGKLMFLVPEALVRKTPQWPNPQLPGRGYRSDYLKPRPNATVRGLAPGRYSLVDTFGRFAFEPRTIRVPSSEPVTVRWAKVERN